MASKEIGSMKHKNEICFNGGHEGVKKQLLLFFCHAHQNPKIVTSDLVRCLFCSSIFVIRFNGLMRFINYLSYPKV
jgi:hypothetical protein